jgi:hypothetical protein
MHDLDRALQEFESDTSGYELESDEFELEADNEFEFESNGESEYEGAADYEGEGDYESGGMRSASRDDEAILDELEEMEQAAALLEVQDEDELEYFLGGLVDKVRKKIRKHIPPQLKKALGGALKKVAKAALPKVGAALGNFVVPGLGGIAGAGLAAKAGQMFGLELEGMSYEDQEFEVARRVVKLGAEATKAAAESGQRGGAGAQAATKAVLQAAQTHAPGLASAASRGPGASPGGRQSGRSGRWFKRGRRIVLVGV